MAKTLRGYQQNGVDKYAETGGSFFAMQMRLGKTLTCISWLKLHKCHLKKILIVAPKTVLISWEKELEEEELPYLDLTQYPLKVRIETMDKGEDAGFYLCNYETLSHIPLKQYHILAGFEAVVLDESTRIKNIQSNAAALCLKAAPYIPFRSCLTGLANPENWMELWTQMAFANGGDWMGFNNFYKWRDALFQNYGFEYVLSPRCQGLISKAFNDMAYVMTRKMAGIKDEKIRQLRVGELSKEARRIYDTVEASWELPGEVLPADRDSLTEGEAKHAMVVDGWLRRITGGIIPTDPIEHIPSWKYDELLHILTEEIKTEQVVVWFAFNAELSRVYALLTEKKIKTCWITGAASQEQRREAINGFQDGKYRVILMQQKCGQYGIDLSAADTSIYFSCHHSHEMRAQSEERVFKVGKTKDLLIIDLITKDTQDEEVYKAIKEKKTNASLLLSRLYKKRGTTPPTEETALF